MKAQYTTPPKKFILPLVVAGHLAALITLLPSLGLAQEEIKDDFKMPIEIGQGFKTAESAPELYIFQTAITPTLPLYTNKNWGQLSFPVTVYYANPKADLSGGVNLALRTYRKNTDLGRLYSIWLFGETAYSIDSRFWVGGGVSVQAGPLKVALHPRAELDRKEFWFSMSLGLDLMTLFNNKEDDDPFE